MGKIKATGKAETATPAKGKTSMYLETNVLEKLRYISFMDRKTQTDVIGEALTEYITKWEKKNGPAKR